MDVTSNISNNFQPSSMVNDVTRQRPEQCKNSKPLQECAASPFSVRDQVHLSEEGLQAAAKMQGLQAEEAVLSGQEIDAAAADSVQGQLPAGGSTGSTTRTVDGADAETDGVEAESSQKKSGSENSANAELTSEQQQEVQELKLRDREVQVHEAAHAAVGGQYAGAPTLTYKTGPDGQRYAVEGHVNIDMSEIPGDPRATMKKADVIRAAALAPAQPSGQDRNVAAKAVQMKASAQAELMTESAEAANKMVKNDLAASYGSNGSSADPAPVSAGLVSLDANSQPFRGAVA
ncbi:MAG: hypothetical protein J7K75_00080 [Desulfuromonas sp.]|nr:hypothetical protein [Desulfuromonas sp.]